MNGQVVINEHSLAPELWKHELEGRINQMRDAEQHVANAVLVVRDKRIEKLEAAINEALALSVIDEHEFLPNTELAMAVLKQTLEESE